MSTTYAPSNVTGTCFSKAFLAFLATVSIFALLPLMQMIPPFWITGDPQHTIKTAQDDPPVIIEPIPEKPKEKPKPEKPKLEKPLPKRSLTQIESQFLVGNGLHGYNYADNYLGFIDTDEDLDLYELDELEKKPRAIFQIEPQYPLILKQNHIEGWVLIEWIITDHGKVRSPKVIRSSHREFQQAAIESILKSKWQPGEIGNRPVNTRVRQKIEFNL